MKRAAFVLTLIALISAFAFGASAAAAPETTAQSAVLYNAESGLVLYEKEADKAVAPSSLVKIMTALIAIENIDNLDDSTTVSQTASAPLPGSSTMGLLSGEVVALRDLLNGAVIRSAADCCRALAEYVAGSEASFVALMNEKAQQLGMTSTHFSDCYGGDSSTQYTTARDLLKLTLYAMQNPTYMEICNTQYKYLPATNKQSERRYYYSTNYMIISNTARRIEDYYYRYANGIMSAYSADAGYCLVSSAKRNDMNNIAIVLGCTRDQESELINSYIDAKALFNWSFENYKYILVAEEDKPYLETALRLTFETDYLILAPSQDFYALIPAEAEIENLETVANIAESYNAPVEKGDVVGTVEFYYDGVKYGEMALAATESYDRSLILYILYSIGRMFSTTAFRIVAVVLSLLILIYIVLVVNNHRRKRRRRRHPRRRYYR